MTTYLFSDEELSHLKYIRENSPLRIRYEHIRYVFEYENFYFLLEVKLAEKFNFSEESFLNQYVMITQMKFVDEKYVAQEGSELLIENEKVLKIEITRTKLYFSKHSKISENYYNTESAQINPIQNLPLNIEIEKIVLVDAGIILTTENDHIFNFFLNDNDDDFTSNDFLYREGNFYEELGSKYQFIALS
jgi:hypothetical protein